MQANYVDISMIKATASSVIILFFLLACQKPEMKLSAMPSTPVDTMSDTIILPNPVIYKTYLALGDSYTIGQSVAVNERFPVQTVTLLNSPNVKFSQPEIIAQTGWTTGNLLSRLDNTPPLKTQYDIVTLLIGVNNQYQHRTQEEYAQQFTALLEKSIHYAGDSNSHVIVLSIPDYSVTPFAAGSNRELTAKQIDSFNSINKNISEQYGVNYLDITGDTRQASTNLSLVANDGLHPSGTEYAVWAGKLAPMIRTLFP